MGLWIFLVSCMMFPYFKINSWKEYSSLLTAHCPVDTHTQGEKPRDNGNGETREEKIKQQKWRREREDRVFTKAQNRSCRWCWQPALRWPLNWGWIQHFPSPVWVSLRTACAGPRLSEEAQLELECVPGARLPAPGSHALSSSSPAHPAPPSPGLLY